MASIKLVISYHKPDVLLSDDILTPIHAGRALAKRRMSADDPKLDWLLKHTIGDDSGSNISEKNSSYNEMTSVYWAWQNYAELGDPDYVGFMHYRRHFLFKGGNVRQVEVANLESPDYLESTLGYSRERLEELLAECDFVYTRPHVRNTVRDHYAANHHIEDLDLAIEILRERFPEYSDAADKYLGGDRAVFCNMIILPKELFFRYAEYMFGILFELERRADMSEKRMFVSEWLTGIFITKLLAEGYRGVSLPMVVAEGPHPVPIVVAASQSYVQPLAVTLTSLLVNARPNTNYEIYVLVSEEYPEAIRAKFDELVARYPGASIQYLVINDEFDEVQVATPHVRIQTYFRLLIPSRLPHLDRVIYLDADVVVERDLTPLLRMVVDDKYIAGVSAAGYQPRSAERAAQDGLPSYDQYVNAGVLLMNLAKMRRDGLEARFMELAEQDLESDDQDVINIACYNAIRLLPPRFNFMTKYRPGNVDEFFAYTGTRQTWTQAEYQEAATSPVVIHYADARKPWLDLSIDFADRWWRYAMLSPFAADIAADWLTDATDACHKKILDYRASLVTLRRERSPRTIKKYQDAVVANAALERELRDARRTLRAVRRSRAFKIGLLVTALPRRVKSLVRPAASSGRKTSQRPTPGGRSGGGESAKPAPVPTRAGSAVGTRPKALTSRPRLTQRLKNLVASVVPSSRRQVGRITRSQARLDARVTDLEASLLAMEVGLAIKVAESSARTVETVEQAVETLGRAVETVRQVVGTVEHTVAGSDAAVHEQAAVLQQVIAATEQIAERTQDTLGAAGQINKDVLAVDQRIESTQASLERVLNRSTEAYRAANETLWSTVYHDTVLGSAWFTDKTLSPGRWAVGYPLLYLLYRLLDEMRPRSILELGLGQSTKMIAQYAARNMGVRHTVVEHDQSWVDFFQTNSALSESSQLTMLNLTEQTVADDPAVLRYEGFAESVGHEAYDLILVDGPFGGAANKYARVDVLDLIPGSLASRFAIIMDDYNRSGEQQTVDAIRQMLTEAGIEFTEASYAGSKVTWLAASPDLSFFASL